MACAAAQVRPPVLVATQVVEVKVEDGVHSPVKARP